MLDMGFLPDVERIVAMIPALTTVTAVPFGAYLDTAGRVIPLALANVDIGLLAVCPPNGAASWLAEFSAAMLGRPVLLIPDNDVAGLTMAEMVIGSLLRAGVSDLRVLWPGRGGYEPPPNGGDVTDWLRREHPGRPAGHLLQALRAVIRAAGKYQFQPGSRSWDGKAKTARG